MSKLERYGMILDWESQTYKEKKYFVDCMNGLIDICSKFDFGLDYTSLDININNIMDPEELYEIAVEGLNEGISEKLIVSAYDKALNKGLDDDYGGNAV